MLEMYGLSRLPDSLQRLEPASGQHRAFFKGNYQTMKTPMAILLPLLNSLKPKIQ
jgi:hypothetical protein